MLVDRHHVEYLIELGLLAEGKSALQLASHKGRLDAFLRTLLAAASPAGREAFAHCMLRLPTEGRPWSAVRVASVTANVSPGAGHVASGPPAALLLLGQLDDDPDAEEDGNRLPGRTMVGPWARLYDALERWDTAEIQRWIGPLGWQTPRNAPRLRQEAEPCGSLQRANRNSMPARAGAKESRS